MADEQVTRGSAGPAQRQPRRRRGQPRAAAEETDQGGRRHNLDERERNVGLRRKAMGPVAPPEGGPGTRAAGVADVPEVAPTDPQ